MDINPFQIVKVRRAKRLWRLETLPIEIFWNFFLLWLCAFGSLTAEPSVMEMIRDQIHNA